MYTLTTVGSKGYTWLQIIIWLTSIWISEERWWAENATCMQVISAQTHVSHATLVTRGWERAKSPLAKKETKWECMYTLHLYFLCVQRERQTLKNDEKQIIAFAYNVAFGGFSQTEWRKFMQTTLFVLVYSVFFNSLGRIIFSSQNTCFLRDSLTVDDLMPNYSNNICWVYLGGLFFNVYINSLESFLANTMHNDIRTLPTANKARSRGSKFIFSSQLQLVWQCPTKNLLHAHTHWQHITTQTSFLNRPSMIRVISESFSWLAGMYTTNHERTTRHLSQTGFFRVFWYVRH